MIYQRSIIILFKSVLLLVASVKLFPYNHKLANAEILRQLLLLQPLFNGTFGSSYARVNCKASIFLRQGLQMQSFFHCGRLFYQPKQNGGKKFSWLKTTKTNRNGH